MRPAPRETRDQYAVVGTAMRASIERAIAAGGLNRLARVYLAVLYLTASYSRLTDRVFVAQIAVVARIAGDVDERHTRRALSKLARLGVIGWEPSRGRKSASWVSLTPSAARRPLMAALPGGKPGQNWPGENPARTGPPPEEDQHREGTAAEQEQDRKALDLGVAGTGAEPVKLSDPAAAAELLAPTETRVEEIVKALPGNDDGSLAQVLPVALQLPAHEVERIASTIRERKARNPVGLFVQLLRQAVTSRRRAAAAASFAAITNRAPADELAAYVASLASYPDDVVRDLVCRRLRRTVADEAERAELSELAERLLAEREEAA
jgi:hypothetical protein